jgi:hypothetical protein
MISEGVLREKSLGAGVDAFYAERSVNVNFFG